MLYLQKTYDFFLYIQYYIETLVMKKGLKKLSKFSNITFIRNITFIDFDGKVPPSRLFHPSRLLGTQEYVNS